MNAFTGTLNVNEFYGGLFNAYRLIYTYADNLSALDGSLASQFRTDGGSYSDKSVYTDVDVLMSRVWDPNNTNVLEPEMVVAPKQQQIVVNKFRQIGLYTDKYLSKRAWMDPDVYDEFANVVQAQVINTRKVYDQRLVDTYIGTTATAVGSQTQTVDIYTTATGDEKNRIEAQLIAQKIADILVEVGDSTRDWNDNGFLKAFGKDDLMIIWNSKWYNKILYTDLPTIYHKEDLIKAGKVLPARYFGTAVGSSGSANGTTHRAAGEYKIRVNSSTGAYSASGTVVKNVFPGDLLPSGTPIVAPATAETTATYTGASINGRTMNVTVYSTVHAYTEADTCVCKIIHRNGVKYLSSFETSTEFWNPRNLTTNRYLTWAYANPEYLQGYPFITLNYSNTAPAGT